MTTAAPSMKERPELRRLALIGAVLLAEYLAFSFAFDAQRARARGGVWLILGNVGAVGPLLVAAAAALLLVAPRLKVLLANAPAPRPLRLPILGLHFILAGSFFALTWALFARPEAPAGPVELWLAAWVLCALASVLTLVHAVLGRDMAWLLRTFARAFAVAGALGGLAWGAGRLGEQMWKPLSGLTFDTVSTLLRALGFTLDIDYQRRVLGIEGFSVKVAPVCSGIEGLGLYLVLMSGFLVQHRRTLRFPHALALLPLGMLATWLGNSVRIAALMVIGARVDAQVAIGSFHSKAGWVFFSAIAIGMAALAKRSRLFSRAPSAEETEPNPVSPWILPLLAWLFVSLALSALSEGHDPLYGVRIVISSGVLWYHRRSYAELLRAPSLLAWVVGVLVGVGWLVVPYPHEAVVPLEGWSDAAYYGWLVTRTLGAVVLVPICEELAFRGFLARWLSRRDFWLVSFGALGVRGIVLSSLAFGALHDRWFLGALTGIVYALLVRKSGRLIDAVAAHAASNAVIAVWVLVTQRWQHW